MKKPVKKRSNLFFQTFIGEYVNVTINLEVTSSINLSEDGHAHEIRIPLTITGFMMDFDGEFIYLSPDGKDVNQAFLKSDLKHIEILKIKDEMEQALDDVEAPESEKDYN